jgi:hypothetical protein
MTSKFAVEKMFVVIINLKLTLMSVHYRRVKIPGVFTTGEFRIPVMQHCPGTRVSDPDPHGSALHLSPGSGSAFQMRIRIQLFIKLAPKAQIIHII